jgi:hypothetical protein
VIIELNYYSGKQICGRHHRPRGLFHQHPVSGHFPGHFFDAIRLTIRLLKLRTLSDPMAEFCQCQSFPQTVRLKN